MTARSAAQPSRTVRIFAAQALAGVAALAITVAGWPAAAGASGSSPGPGGAGISSLQTQAQELAGEINADNQALDELDASYDADQITYSQLQKKQSGLRLQIKASAAAVAAARAALRQQAIIDYMAGGAPIITEIPDQPGLDPSLTVAYAAIIAGGQKRAENDYAATLDTQAAEESALSSTTREAALALNDVRNDESQAAATLAAQKQALAQVTGQLAIEVAAVQAQQQAAEQAHEEQTLAAQGELPGGTTPVTPAASQPIATATSTPDDPTPDAPTTADPTTATPATQAKAPATPTTQAPTPTTTPPSAGSNTAQAPGVSSVLAYARAQLGKPYQWGGAGPNSFDCSGLVMMAWQQAGIDFPHLAQDQYDLTARIPLSDLIPGDLVFFGTPNDVYHVGIYVGSGNMIDAPETGQNVSVQPIYWSDLLGAGRVTTSS